MDVINDMIMPPQVKELQVISYLVYFMLLFHLPFMGMVLGSSGLSVVYRRWQPKLSNDLIRLTMGNVWVWIALGVLPAGVLAFLFKSMYYNTPIDIHFYIFRLMGLLLFALVLLTFYRLTNRLFLGLVGLLVLSGYCFHFMNLLSLLLFPEKWPFLKGFIPFPLFSITPLIQFGVFILLALMVTGAGVLFIYYWWPEKRLGDDTPHYHFLKYNAYGLILAGSFLMPLMLFWDLLNLPGYSLSIGVFVLYGLIILVVFVIMSMTVWMIKNYQERVPRFGTWVFILVVVLVAMAIGKDQLLRRNANLETMTILQMEAEKVQRKIVMQREEIYSKSMVVDEKLGEQVFNNRCTACHSFEKKMVGPAFNQVLPKYEGKEKELLAFIKNPKKVDPAFPAMPDPGLTTIQVKSVVKYLIGKVGGGEVEDQEKLRKADENEEGVERGPAR